MFNEEYLNLYKNQFEERMIRLMSADDLKIIKIRMLTPLQKKKNIVTRGHMSYFFESVWRERG